MARKIQSRDLQSGLVPDFKTILLFFQFMPFERRLLTDVARVRMPQEIKKRMEGRSDLKISTAKSYLKWQWTSDVMHQVLTDLHKEQVGDDH